MEKEGTLSRRALVGLAGMGAATFVVGGAVAAPPAHATDDDQGPGSASGANPDEQYGFLVNVHRCIGCGKCEEACRLWSRTREGEKSRRTVRTLTSQAGRELHVSTSCMHCEDPACARVCPAGAISKGAGGIVVVDEQRCIGCKYCYQACPYGVPSYNDVSMDKCDYCFGAGVALGEPTHCVKACKVHALRNGKLSELLALSEKTRQVEGPTGAACVLV